MGKRLRTLRRTALRCIAAMVSAAALSGCTTFGTLDNGRGWGQDAKIWPGWQRLGCAAREAALHPGTWVPAAGALVFTVDDFDRRVSDWAVEHRPIYGSADTASDLNEVFTDVLKVSMFATAFATPSGDVVTEHWAFGEQDAYLEQGPVLEHGRLLEGPWPSSRAWLNGNPEQTDWPDRSPAESLVRVWLPAKAKGVALEWLGHRSTMWTVERLKEWSGRTRPDGSDDRSFPSADASRVFSRATFSSLNLDSIPMPALARGTARVGFYTLASAVAWQRIEQGAHFPSDVLAGAALGHFVATFFHHAFLGLEEESQVEILVAPTAGGAWGQIGFRF